jgi:hypothetical protein
MTVVLLIASTLVVAGGPGTVDGESGGSPADDATLAERRAVAFLSREVAQWSKENHCFSCHNNGDAARALLAARRKGLAVPEQALRDTVDFLGHPERWDRNGVDAAFSDKKLARIQFAHALAASVSTGALKDREPLLHAAGKLRDDQTADGSWKVDDNALVGSPATYGTALATAAARVALAAAGADEFRPAIDRADRWLMARPIQNVLDASAILYALEMRPGREKHLADCLEMLRRSQAPDGGWGPFLNAPPESFDTAIALIGLSRWPDRETTLPMIRRGRAYLIQGQVEDGSWPETTRPSGSESYAQRLSTAGWATLALLATDG